MDREQSSADIAREVIAGHEDAARVLEARIRELQRLADKHRAAADGWRDLARKAGVTVGATDGR